MKGLPTILVTGANGFVGGHFLQILQAEHAGKYNIIATYLGEIPESHKISGIDWVMLDISNKSEVYSAIQKSKPDFVLHLAAVSHVPTASAAIEQTWQINVMGSLYLFEAIKEYAPECGIIFVSSSEVYGESFKDKPELDETACLSPMNSYASSKAAIDLLSAQLAHDGQRIIRVRPFNHVGPGQTENFVVPAFASQIARIEAGQQEEVIRVGNLSAIRDFLDVRDVVQAYIQLIENFDSIEKGSVFNIASGNGKTISTLLDMLLEQSPADVTVEQEAKRMRPVEINNAVGNADKLKKQIGWQPVITIEQTLTDVLTEWRSKLNS